MKKQDVRTFTKQGAEEQGIPFSMHLSASAKKRTLGIANGKYNIPDNVDENNDEIAKMFGVE